MTQEVLVTILVADGFIPTELALVQDTLRIANRLDSNPHFNSQVCSADGEGVIEGKGGLLVRATSFGMDEPRLPDHLIVLGGSGVGDGFNKLCARLRRIERTGGNILLLSNAASEWKRLHRDSERMTTHWEIQQLDQDAGFTLGHDLPLFSRTSRITTAAGMISTADVILNSIVAPLSLRLAQAVGHVLLMDRIRDGDADQPRSENDVNSLRLVNLEPVIAEMEQHLDAPLVMGELAAVAGFSIRQLERKFKAAIGQTPAAFYRSLRLRRARNLIEQTELTVFEISVACGCGSTSNFSKMYAREFGMTPTQRRIQLSAAATQHHFCSQSHRTNQAPIPVPACSLRPSAHLS